LHLHEASALHLLAQTGEVWIPDAVDFEMMSHVSDWQQARPEWLKVQSVTGSQLANALAWQQAGLLGAGEAEAIALAQAIGADWFLTDDAAARLFAQSLRLEAHGSLGVVLWCAGAGFVGRVEAEEVIDRLDQSSLWISRRVLAAAKAALDQLCQSP